jgi:hypothetical protein
MTALQQLERTPREVADADTDLIELYYERGWTDGLPVVPPTPEKIAACIAALGGDSELVECKVAPRWGLLTREVLAINMVSRTTHQSYAPPCWH